MMTTAIPEVVLKIEALRKTFRVGFWGKPVTAVEYLDLEVRRGEIFGFLGPNGAGKTTTLKILMGHAPAHRHRSSPDQRSTFGDSRRADVGTGSCREKRNSRPDSSSQGPGQDGLLQFSYSSRRRGPLRPGRDSAQGSASGARQSH